MADKVFFFGCWNEAGHFLRGPGGPSRSGEGPEVYGELKTHLDGTLAPRKHSRSGELCFGGQGKTQNEVREFDYYAHEVPQGQFFLHVLAKTYPYWGEREELGTYTAIQWWDRVQGDSRGACNSTILREGVHTSVEMLETLAMDFPHVLVNLTKAGITLVELEKPK